MKELKVFLQKPVGVADSSYYRYLMDFPPKGVKYTGSKSFKVLTGKRSIRFNSFIKYLIKRIVSLLRIRTPNAYYTKDLEKKCLIHCTHCLSKNDSPWVADFEYPGQFWFGGDSKSLNESLKKKIRAYTSSANCKKIMPWSEWSKKNILKEFPELKKKIEVVYPGVPAPKNLKRKKDNKTRILFVGRDFEIKGGEIAIEVMDRITKKYENVEGVVVSEVQEKILDKFKRNKNIKFLGLVSPKKLFEEIYPSSDIFLYPTFSDTLGFAILEAQGFGLPVIAQKTKSTHTISETISEGKTGFVIDNLNASGNNRQYNSEVIGQITKKCDLLIRNRELLQGMKRNAREEIVNGKFSIGRRNKHLKKIYSEALRK